MDIKSIFTKPKRECNRRQYSNKELRMIMDYLMNESFDFCFAFDCLGKVQDQISGDIITIGDGAFFDGEYLWTYYEPMYVYRYGLSLDENFLERIKSFYDEGNIVNKKRFEWRHPEQFFRKPTNEELKEQANDDSTLPRPRQLHSDDRQFKPVDPPA